MRASPFALLVAGTLTLLAASSAHAQDDATEARALFDEAVAEADAGHLERAVELFARSTALVERASTVFNLGVALATLGRHQEALDAFEHFLRIAGDDVDATRRDEAARRMVALRALRTRVEVRVSPSQAEVWLDGARSGSGPLLVLAVEPGSHELSARAEGHAPASQTVEAALGERVALSLTLTPLDAGGSAEFPALDFVAITTLVLGAAAIGTAIGATIVREEEVSRFNGPECAPTPWGARGDRCPELLGSIDTWSGTAIGMWIVGGALAGTGLGFALIPRDRVRPEDAPHRGEAAAARPRARALRCDVGLGSLTCVGSF